MKLTTTLARIRACSPCTYGWKTLNKFLGKGFDNDTEINLLTILESNGIADMLWCLRATIQDSKRTAAQLAIEFAEQALPIFESRRPNNLRPRQAIQAARNYLESKITINELREARSNAYAADAATADADAYAAAAATAAADAAAYAADATAAADAAAYAAAYAAADATAAADAAAYAADAAAYAADARKKARDKQTKIIKMILEY